MLFLLILLWLLLLLFCLLWFSSEIGIASVMFEFVMLIIDFTIENGIYA